MISKHRGGSELPVVATSTAASPPGAASVSLPTATAPVVVWDAAVVAATSPADAAAITQTADASPAAVDAAAPPGDARPAAHVIVVPVQPSVPATHAPPPVVRAVGEGSLLVQVDPWADVTVDGTPRGTTPVRLKLSAGPHRVTLANKTQKEDVTVNIVLDGTTKLERSW